MIPVLILAAGQSARMGGSDKLLQFVDGQPLLRRVASAALQVSDAVFVALPPGNIARLDVLEGLAVTPLALPDSAEGMSGTLRAGVAGLPDCKAFMVLLADLPQITGSEMQQVIAARATAPDKLIWRGATAAGKAGHPIIFDASLRAQFAGLSGDSGGEDLVRPLRSQTHLVRFDDDRARLDLDTPADWAAFRSMKE